MSGVRNQAREDVALADKVSRVESPYYRNAPKVMEWVTKGDGSMERVQVLSLIWWAVPCRRCKAEPGVWCSSVNGKTHEIRKKDYYSKFPSVPFADRPSWFQDLQERRLRREAIMKLRRVSRDQARISHQLSKARTLARVAGVPEDHIAEALAAGRGDFREEKKAGRAR